MSGRVAYRMLGGTGLSIAPIVLGGNVFGWTADRATSFAVLDAFLEAGFNAIDTADVYNRFAPGLEGGESETIIGAWMADRGVRDRVVLITKGGLDMEQGGEGLGRDYLPRACEASLRRLRTDRVDVYMAHRSDPATPIGETLETFRALIDAGKVGHAGCSNYSPDQLEDALATGGKDRARYAVMQPHYNLADRAAYEGQVERACVGHDVGVIAYYALAAGFLTGKYRDAAAVAGHARQSVLSRYTNARGFGIVDALHAVARRHGATPAQVALAWVLARPSVTAPLASATGVAQLHDILAAVDLTLEAEDMRDIDAAHALPA